MSAIKKKRKSSRFKRIVYFFPFQLLLVHFKTNILLLLVWLILFGFLSGSVGAKYGIGYLFIYPEYLDQVNFWSFGILGFTIGGFISAFNVYSYIRNGPDFPFIATLSRPFHKYSINNFIIPSVFLGFFGYHSFQFQYYEELLPFSEIMVNFSGFAVGMSLFFLLSIAYFFRTNKDIYKISGKDNKYFDSLTQNEPIDTVLHRGEKWFRRLRKSKSSSRGWHIETYLSSFTKIKISRSVKHYDDELIKKVFVQNHINASLFEISLFIAFILVGVFQNSPLFAVPAGASIMLLITMTLMLLSTFRSWFKSWTLAAFLVGFIAFNFSIDKLGFLNFENPAYGLNYAGKPADYNLHCNYNDQDETICQADIAHGIKTLENWKKNTGQAKPLLVVLNSSGGGLRSALWTYSSLSYLDSVTETNFFKHVQFSTGASGGMIGAAYFRELYRRRLLGEVGNPNLINYKENICRDLLNPVGLSIATNDFFVRLQTYQDDKYSYTKDRGLIFEQKLDENTFGVLNKSINSYRKEEHAGTIPLMLFSPVIVNDSRRLLISSQPISYLCKPQITEEYNQIIENIEFQRLFENHDAGHLSFLTALRMNASFPYIMPTITLPTEPKIALVDAGIRDNLGILTTESYIRTFKDWIEKNTSGVVILQIRDTKKNFTKLEDANKNLGKRITSPLSTFGSNFIKVQDYNNDRILTNLKLEMGNMLNFVTIELDKEGTNNASLSMHLTGLEKREIEKEIYSQNNQNEILRLLKLLDQ